MIEDNSKVVIKEMKNAARRGCRAVAKEIKEQTVATLPTRRGITKQQMKHGARLSRTTLAKGTVGFLKKKEARKKFPTQFIVNPAWLEFGTQSHSLKVNPVKKTLKRGGVKLGAMANKSKNQIFGKAVQHPGARANKNMTKAGQLVSGKVMDIIAGEMKILNEKTATLERMADDGDDDI